MYHIRPVVLKNGPIERTRLVIDFDDPNMKIVGEFLMADAPLLRGQILQDIHQVLTGNKSVVTSNGNRCALTIRPHATVITDLFEGMDGVQAYPPYEIDTNTLRELIVMWFQELDTIHQDK